MIDNYINWLSRWRYGLIFLILLLVIWAASGMQFLQFKSDYRMFFSEDNPQLLAFEKLQDTYSKSDNVLFVIAPKDGKVFTVEVLAMLEKMTEMAWQIPFSSRVDSITNFQYSRAVEDDIIVEDLIFEAEKLTASQLEQLKKIAVNEPLLVNNLISPKAHVTSINVTLQLPGKDQNSEIPKVVQFARDLAAKMRKEYPNIDIYITGGAMMDNAFGEISASDMQQLVPIMFIVLLITLGLLLATITGIVTTTIIIVFSVISTLGLAGWLGISMSPPTAPLPNIIMTLAVADSVHIMASFFYCLREGMAKRAALIESFHLNFQAIFLTSFTTAIGFLSMNFSDSPPFNDLGNLAAIGVTIAFILTITLLPALLMILPTKFPKQRQISIMNYLSEFVIQRRKILLWSITALMLGLVIFIPKNELNDNYLKYFDESIEFRQVTEFMIENLSGADYLDYSIESGEANGINDPKFLIKLDEFVNWFRQQPEVRYIYSITEIIKRLNKNMHGDDSSWYKLPESRELTAQYLLLYEMSLPYGLDLNDRLNVDKSATRITVIIDSLSSKELLALEHRAKLWLQGQTTIKSVATGTSLIFAHIGQRNIHTMLIGTTVALLLISLVLIFALRSLKLGLISMIPNLMPAIMAFGLWGLLVGQISLAVSVVAAMTLGIVVDATIHFLTNYLHARQKLAKNAMDAVRYAFTTVGTAISVTAIVLIAGFSILIFSHFHINSAMGILTAIIIVFALITDFLLLPPLLMKLDRDK
jgi:predicted RND superfamily exporter protein